MPNDRKKFDTESDAAESMYECVNDECVDNYRFAFEDDETAMVDYDRRRDSGCCGSFDEEVVVNGRNAVIGCNYGH